MGLRGKSEQLPKATIGKLVLLSWTNKGMIDRSSWLIIEILIYSCIYKPPFSRECPRRPNLVWQKAPQT